MLYVILILHFLYCSFFLSFFFGWDYIIQHVEVPVPSLKKNEILVKVEAIALNPFDWKIQKGVVRPIYPRKFPHIPGFSLSLFPFLFLFFSIIFFCFNVDLLFVCVYIYLCNVLK